MKLNFTETKCSVLIDLLLPLPKFGKHRTYRPTMSGFNFTPPLGYYIVQFTVASIFCLRDCPSGYKCYIVNQINVEASYIAIRTLIHQLSTETFS